MARQTSTERKKTLALLAKSRARDPTNLDADEVVAMMQARQLHVTAACLSVCLDGMKDDSPLSLSKPSVDF